MILEIELYTGGHAGESVYDPFVEVETTMIADEETGGVCDAIELNPKSVAMTIRRWELASHPMNVVGPLSWRLLQLLSENSCVGSNTVCLQISPDPLNQLIVLSSMDHRRHQLVSVSDCALVIDAERLSRIVRKGLNPLSMNSEPRFFTANKKHFSCAFT